MPKNSNADLIGKLTESYLKSVEKLRLKDARMFSAAEFEKKADSVFIYIPTYNRSKYLLERSLPSILSQTHKNYIVLIVDDGGCDDTYDVIKSFNDSRLNYLKLPFRTHRFPDTSENRWLAGPIYPANVALQQVPRSSKWIARIDDDEVWLPSHLEESLQFANEHNLEFVTSGSISAYTTKPEEEWFGDHIKSNYFYPGSGEDISSPRIGSTSSIVYRSYLNCFKYNSDCWRKGHNRVNDIDLYVRFFEAGVLMGHTGLITVRSIPREESGDLLGIKAYLA